MEMAARLEFIKTKIFQYVTEIGEAFWIKSLYFDRNEFRDGAGRSKKEGVSIRLIKNN